METEVIIPIDERRDGAAASAPGLVITPAVSGCFMLALLLTATAFVAIDIAPAYNSDDRDNHHGHGQTTVAPTTTTTTAFVPIGGTNPNVIFYAIDSQNQLYRYNTSDVSSPIATIPITGLDAGDSLNDIDFRPASGALYGTSNTRLYVIHEYTGFAHRIGSTFISKLGNLVSLEFNPVIDRIRIITSTGRNLQVHPETGAIVSSSVAKPAVDGSVAYSNNLGSANASTLYIIDLKKDVLLRQNSPDHPKVVRVGSGLGLDIDDAFGFDISPDGDTLACVGIGTTRRLYMIDITSGQFNLELGIISQPIISLAIPVAVTSYSILASSGNLFIANNLRNSFVLATKTITGLGNGERITSIDMRPSNGRLYAASDANRLYYIDLGTGAATAACSTPFANTASGVDFSIEFDPQRDVLRVVSTQGDNLRVNPNTGAVIARDTNLNPGSPRVASIAYSNNFAGTSSTILYDIDISSQRLYKQDPPNSGTLVDIGPLGVSPVRVSGFDISSKLGHGIAVFTVDGITNVYLINLATGAALKDPKRVFPETTSGYTLSLNI